MRDLPILTRQVGVDAWGHLILHEFPPGGSGPGKLTALDLATGRSTELAPGAPGPFDLSPDRRRLLVLSDRGEAGEAVIELWPILTGPAHLGCRAGLMG